MLVLSRKESEKIRLGDSIVVTVVRVSGDKVRLGIEAPPDVLVLREELEPHRSGELLPDAVTTGDALAPRTLELVP
jgi:carbon storage regulator